MTALIDIDQLRTFIAIAETGSFTKAAEVVHKTQSAVSMQMKRLEERLNKPIFARDGRALVAAANLSPVPRTGYRLPMPRPGRWSEVLNTDAEAYGGANLGNMGGVRAEEVPWGGEGASAEVTIPPLGVVWLTPDE